MELEDQYQVVHTGVFHFLFPLPSIYPVIFKSLSSTVIFLRIFQIKTAVPTFLFPLEIHCVNILGYFQYPNFIWPVPQYALLFNDYVSPSYPQISLKIIQWQRKKNVSLNLNVTLANDGKPAFQNGCLKRKVCVNVNSL